MFSKENSSCGDVLFKDNNHKQKGTFKNPNVAPCKSRTSNIVVGFKNQIVFVIHTSLKTTSPKNRLKALLTTPTFKRVRQSGETVMNLSVDFIEHFDELS